MAEIYNNKICVLANELIAFNPKTGIGSKDGFISESSFYMLKKRKQLTVARRSIPGYSALIYFDTMRRDLQEQYTQKKGDPRALLHKEKNLLEDHIIYTEEVHSKLMEYRDESDKKLKPEKIAEYTLNARIIEAIIAVKNNKKALTIGAGSTRFNIWEKLSKHVNELKTLKDVHGNLIFPHNLPANHLSLKRKVMKYEQKGWISLVHGGRGNISAAKVKTVENEAAIHQLLSVHTNLNNAQIMKEYNKVANIMGWEPLSSPKTIDNYRKKHNVTTVSLRQGSGALNNNLKKQIHRSAPTTALTYWTLDGWTVELLYQKKQKKARKDANGNENSYMLTTYSNRKTMVVVLDPCCKYPVGYAIGDHESPELIRTALRNAIKHTKELFGSRYKPMQLQSDNYQKKVMVPFYEGMTKHYTPAALKNAKSKVIEPYFKYLNTEYCQLQPNWAGFGITADKDKQPNTEIMNANHKFFPDEAGVTVQIEEIIRKERAAKLEAYRKAWESTPDERRLPFSDEEYLMLMGDTTGYTNHITGKGLLLTVQGEKINYDSLDISLRNHYNEDWVVRYDPDDFGQMLISNAERLKSGKVGKEYGEYRYMMQRDITVPMALADQRPEHYEYRAKVAQFNKELEQKVLNAQKEQKEILARVFERIPERIGDSVLDRLMITDSRGQHKDPRSEMRKQLQDAEVAEVIGSDEEEYTFDPCDFIASSF